MIQPSSDKFCVCQICKKEMKVITNTHLKSHNITKVEYKKLYPNSLLVSKEQQKKMSERSKLANKNRKGIKRSEKEIENIKNGIKKSFDNGRVQHNKGKNMSESQKELLSKIQKERYNSGVIPPRLGSTHSDDTKKILSEKQKRYANNNPEEMSIRGKKSAETKRKKGYDMAFFKGKKHTEESKRKILESTSKSRELKKQKTIDTRENKIKELGYEILDSDNWFYTLKCNHCGNKIHTTAQNFNDSKIGDVCFLCPTDHGKSKAELEILNFLESLVGRKLISGDRYIIKPKELDIVDDIKKIAIEYCGLNNHGEAPLDSRYSNQGKGPGYHRDKMIKSKDQGYDLITIFSDEYINKKDIVLSVLKQKFGFSDNRIFARKTLVKKVDSLEANKFLNENHLMGSGKSNLRYGLYFNNELISLMTFHKGDITHKSNVWEINRYCCKKNYSVVGGASKLFKQFLKDVDPDKVISYADLRWGDGNVYGNMGFIREKDTVENYWYHDGRKRYHRYSLRKNKDDDQSLTEWENRKKQGWDRIWDCGHAKWVWQK